MEPCDRSLVVAASVLSGEQILRAIHDGHVGLVDRRPHDLVRDIILGAIEVTRREPLQSNVIGAGSHRCQTLYR